MCLCCSNGLGSRFMKSHGWEVLVLVFLGRIRQHIWKELSLGDCCAWPTFVIRVWQWLQPRLLRHGCSDYKPDSHDKSAMRTNSDNEQIWWNPVPGCRNVWFTLPARLFYEFLNGYSSANGDSSQFKVRFSCYSAIINVDLLSEFPGMLKYASILASAC